MSTPYTDNPRISILRSLEQECAQRYSATAKDVDALVIENKILRIQRDALRKIAVKVVDIFDMQAELAEIQGNDFHARNNRQLATDIRTILKDTKEPI